MDFTNENPPGRRTRRWLGAGRLRLAAAEQLSKAAASAPAAGRSATLQKALASAEQRMRQVHLQVDALNRDIASSPATSRPVLDARIEALQAELRLLGARREALHN